MKVIIGTKIGMTQVFGAGGKAMPVTLIHAEPGTVIQVKTKDKDGYRAVQVGVGQKRKIAKPLAGHIKKSGRESVRMIREFRLGEPASSASDKLSGPGEQIDLKVGDRIDVSVFQEGDLVQVTGVSKGKGFAGVVKRHGFHGAPATHGADHQRQPGSIGPQRPQRVLKGKKMPGRMGGERRTVKNLSVIKVDAAHNFLALGGAVPGPNKSYVVVRGQND